MATITPEEAVEIARRVYGLAGTADPLPGEIDDNFHLTTGTGDEFVLKVAHQDRTYEEIDLQCRALGHIADHAPALTLPRVQMTRSGEHIPTVVTADGLTRFAWMLSYIPGQVLAKANPQTGAMLFSLGQLLGRVDAALVDFAHPAARRDFKWDLAQPEWVYDYVQHIDDPVRRKLVERFMKAFSADVKPALAETRKSVIHGDANDYNVLVDEANDHPRRVVGLVDFGDLMHTHLVCEVAVACAYALLDKDDPLAAAAQVVAGYHHALPLAEAEIKLIFPLICARLCVSVTNSAYRKNQELDDPYITISEKPAWNALERLSGIHPDFAHYVLRAACDLPPVPDSRAISQWLASDKVLLSPVLDSDLQTAPCRVFDLGVGSLLLGANPASAESARLAETLFGEMRASNVQVGVGRYDEARLFYDGPNFATGESHLAERRTIHLGMDLFVAAGAPVYAPLDGTVHCLANNTDRLDYGPLVILRHETGGGHVFYTLYGHLSEETLADLQVGQRVMSGECIARVGSPPTNGDWPPHLHFQIITDLLDLDAQFPGVALPSQRTVWLSLSPDPNVILRIPQGRFPPAEPGRAESLSMRQARLGGSVRLSYAEPVKIVRGWKQYLYDDTGRAYLDMYNNVPHVGHSHPDVVRAVHAQMALLNTNTRYLHDNITRYAARLCALMPDPLEVCFFVNSASEANELALRLARAYTGQYDIIALEAAYHGHTTSLIDISHYKFAGPGGQGAKDWVHVAPIPDDYRGPYKRHNPDRGRRYAQHVAAIIARLQIGGGGIAAYIAETLPSVGGQIVLPPGYLAEVYGHVRAAGGVCIADEVQVGFGRLGEAFWGFETQNVVPDIVVLGKPIGNGHPLGAVVTTREIARAFDNGMEFFSTFGGNPVSCAAGMAVLDVLERENLQANALRLGNMLLDGLRQLMDVHDIIGDVRGSGLFLGAELVLDRDPLEPAPRQASYIVDRLRQGGILAGTDGPFHNVLKIRPPMVINETDVQVFLETLAMILKEDGAQP